MGQVFMWIIYLYFRILVTKYLDPKTLYIIWCLKPLNFLKVLSWFSLFDYHLAS